MQLYHMMQAKHVYTKIERQNYILTPSNYDLE